MNIFERFGPNGYHTGCITYDDGTVIVYYAFGPFTLCSWIVPGTWVEPEDVQ